MSDITDLKAEVLLLYKENAELRKQIETLAMYVESDGTRYWVDDDGNQHFDHSAVKDDASELRELVRELWNCALQYHRFDIYRHEIGVDGCGIGCTANGEGCCACKLEQRMRELGVEV